MTDTPKFHSITSTFGLVLAWSNDRNIIKGCTSADQFPKLVSEFSEEVSAAISKCYVLASKITPYSSGADVEKYQDEHTAVIYTDLADAIGDSLVVLTNIAAQEDLDIVTLWMNRESGDFIPTFSNAPYFSANIALGKLADALKKRNAVDIERSITNMLNGLDKLALAWGLEAANCLWDSYLEIKDRKGVMYNGIFVKSDDANYERIIDEIEAAVGEQKEAASNQS